MYICDRVFACVNFLVLTLSPIPLNADPNSRCHFSSVVSRAMEDKWSTLLCRALTSHCGALLWTGGCRGAP